MSTKMDSEKVEKLIKIVRGYVFLYDLSHHQYKNASMKSAVWESIGRELNESGEAVKSKWKTVRDGYTKYKKQLKRSSGSSKKNINYTWAPQLAFLDKYNSSRASPCFVTVDVTQQQIPSPRPITPELNSDSSQDMSSQSSPSPSPSTWSSPQVPPSSQNPLRSESPTTVRIASTASTSRASYRNNRRSSETRKNEDDVGREFQFSNEKKKKKYDVIDNLFLSYADTFKKFPPREQAVVKLELAKLFSNTELQLLNNSI